MKNSWVVFGLFICASLVVAQQVVAQQILDIAPSAETKVDPSAHGLKKISLNPAELNVLSANVAKLSPGLKIRVANFMFLWVQSAAGGLNEIQWLVEVSEAGPYEIDALLETQACQISLEVNGQSGGPAPIAEKKWNRVSLGKVVLNKGQNRVRLKVETDHPFKISAIEMVRPEIKSVMLQDALKMRVAPEWFKDAGYGLMFQWTNRATPPKGPIKPWEQKVNDFDLDAFVRLVDESGASFVVWSITWGQQFISAPIESLDRLIAGRTTQRDLLGEMAVRLHEKGVRLIFYYHYGYDCYHSTDTQWMKAAGGYEADKSEFYQNWTNIVSEVGARYGEKLDGWFFDGGQRYYSTHFDGLDPVGISSAPFKQLGMAARQGNSERMLCYNSWILPRLTEYQDYFAGEGQIAHGKLDDGVFEDGGQQGLMAFGCFVLERRWGHLEENKLIAAPKFTTEKLLGRIKHAKANRYPIAINLEMYEDGSVSPASFKLLQETHEKLKANQE